MTTNYAHTIIVVVSEDHIVTLYIHINIECRPLIKYNYLLDFKRTFPETDHLSTNQ